MNLLFWQKKTPAANDAAKRAHLVREILTPPPPMARYDVLRFDPARKPLDIRTDLTETEQSFYGEYRIKAYATSDQLYDNDNVGSTLDTVVRMTVGTNGGVPQFTGDNKDACQRYFREWKTSAGFADNEHYNDILQLILRTVKLHGDCLIALDPVLTRNKIRIWDADQICPVLKGDFDRWCQDYGGYDATADGGKIPWRCVEGVVIDSEGVVKGYFVTHKRNNYGVSLDDATYLPATLARRISYRRKITQYRGEPLFLPNSEITEDTRNLLKAEVQAAKNNAELSLIVKDSPGISNQAVSALMEGMSLDQATEGTEFTTEELEDLAELKRADRSDFAAFEGKSAIGHIAADQDVIKLNNSDRPSNAIQAWMDHLSDANSKRLGVMSMFGRGRADNSYSSGQIEISISWQAIQEDQKMLERQVVDYVCQTLFPGEPYLVNWPRAFEIDPQKAEQTYDAQLRGGRVTFRELLGPDWREHLDQLAVEKQYLEALGLTNLSFFQTAAGNAAPIIPQQEQDEHDN